MNIFSPSEDFRLVDELVDDTDVRDMVDGDGVDVGGKVGELGAVVIVAIGGSCRDEFVAFDSLLRDNMELNKLLFSKLPFPFSFSVPG